MHNSNNKLTNSILIFIFTLTLTTQAQRVKFANGVSGMFSKKVRPPIIEKLALSDTVGKEWLSYGNKRMETASGKKFAQIKTVLLAYQKWQSFGKFDYYGCYCFTEGMNLAYGRGSPVDEIDSACKRWFTCYQCAEMDATILNRTESREVCNGREQKYNFFADRDDLGLPQIGCKMNGEHDECARAICECDADFIRSLAKYESTYDIEYHRVWGSFDYQTCTQPNPKIKLKSAVPARSKAQLRNAAQESLKIQLTKSNLANGGKEDRGTIDSCCVLEYPKFQLYRSNTQHCCRSEVQHSQLSNVFHFDINDEKAEFACCTDGSVANSADDCKVGLHTEF